MSYLSATENVGFSGIPQNISDASCATQYKMAVNGLDGVPENCAEAMYIPTGTTDDQTYMSHINDNFYTKFKIDPNELYTFHDSDVIANEITVSQTEDSFAFPDSVEPKSDFLDSPKRELDTTTAFTNGYVKKVMKKKVLSNGHNSFPNSKTTRKDVKIKTQAKVQKVKSQVKEVKKESGNKAFILNMESPKVEICTSPPSSSNLVPPNKQALGETFLDVFKREQGLVEDSTVSVKTEPLAPPPPPTEVTTSLPKKISSGKTPSQSKPRRGRGPALHEALQRIPRRAIPVPIKKWHAPGDIDCRSMSSRKYTFRTLDSSSSDEDEIPDIEIGSRPFCIEEIAAESRSARLDFRREAMRKRFEIANETLRLSKRHSKAKELCSIVKKQLNNGSSNLPTQTVNHLLAMRGMTSLFTSDERRRLRESGWSGGESGFSSITEICSEDTCTKPSLPCGRYCLAHITLAPEQRLYASCAAVFAMGSKCNYPLLPLKDQLPLCAEHAWKRDNYDKLILANKPKKVVRPRLLPAPRRPKRRRRPPPPPPRVRPPAPAPSPAMPESESLPALAPPPALSQSLSEINVCSNSSAYDSSEDTHMGVLSENEYAAASYPHELEVEVVHDILDPSVLSQMPDEVFTEFLNQEESGTFGESSELAAALEAVLDERVLDERELDDAELDEGELDDGEIEETVLEDETLHTMDDSMFVEEATVDKIKVGIPAVSQEVTTSAPS